MSLKSLWSSLVTLWKRLFKRSMQKDTVLDTASLKVFGLEICLTRELPKSIPYEFSMLIPRAEYRIKGNTPSCTDEDMEVVLNTITIAHSPRFEGMHRGQPPSSATDCPDDSDVIEIKKINRE